MSEINGNLASQQSEAADVAASKRVETLRREIERRDAVISELHEKNCQIRQDKENLEFAFNSVLNSLSWRITAPLRRVTAWARALFPLFRFEVWSFELKPFDHGEELGGHALRMTTKTGTLPEGWGLLSASISEDVSDQYFTLYHDTGTGFDVAKRITLPFSREQRIAHLINLPCKVKRLRIDSFDPDTANGLREVKFRALGTVQVVAFLLGKQLRAALSNPRALGSKAQKFCLLLKSGGLPALRAHLLKENFSDNYQEWVRKNDTLSDTDRQRIGERIESLAYSPLISVLMPVYNTPAEYLRSAIGSVLKQLYPNWELCVADDASSAPHVRAMLKEYAASDRRIKVTYRGSNGHIAAASNSAFELVTGEFVALLDHDDELREHALYMLAEKLNQQRGLDLIYSDEDKITSYGARVNPYFKPDWNPELLRSQNYICHLVCFRTSLVRKLGGFRSGFDGAQDWDLILRAADATDRAKIAHIPHVLYHWRIIEGSTAQATAHKPYVLKAQAKCVAEHLERIGIQGAQTEILDDISQIKVSYPLPKPLPLVSIIIPTRDQVDFLKTCVSSILSKSTYRNFELLIVDNASEKPETLEYLEKLQATSSVRVIHDPLPFNYSRINNAAARQAKGNMLAFLNNDIEVVSSNWLEEMVSLAARPENGAVGAKLLYPNELVQHAGVVLGIGGVAGHNHKGRKRDDVGYFNRLALRSNFSAVTAACMLMRKDLFWEVGGFDESELAVAFNDVDLCLKVEQAGYFNVYTPYAELLHFESVSRGYELTPAKFQRFESEVKTMKARWGERLQNDPYYNPNLTLIREDFSFAYPSRAMKPWLS